MTATILRGDARNLPLADESVDLVVTSPPYFALRSYQDGGEHYAGQIGDEATPTEFLDALLEVTAECVRVLKPSGSIFVNLGDKYGPDKSLLLIPEEYRIRARRELGLIARAVIVWDKPNGLPESVTDRVRRSHEDWVHLTKRPRYYSAVDEIREEHITDISGWKVRSQVGELRGLSQGSVPSSAAGIASAMGQNPLGKLPGSVWRIATEPLNVPDHLGVDHFAAFPTEWPRRIIQGWSPREVCTACGEGRRPVSTVTPVESKPFAIAQHERSPLSGGTRNQGLGYAAAERDRTITGHACACPDTSAPATPGVVLDPCGGTGTVALVADALGRHGISVDMSADYCRLAEWRTTDPKQLAKAARRPFEPPREQVDGQEAFQFEEESA